MSERKHALFAMESKHTSDEVVLVSDRGVSFVKEIESFGNFRMANHVCLVFSREEALAIAEALKVAASGHRNGEKVHAGRYLGELKK